MLNYSYSWQGNALPYNIKVELVDENGIHLDPHQVKDVEYLSRFQHKSVVNKIYHEMVEGRRSGVIEVYHDKIVVKEN